MKQFLKWLIHIPFAAAHAMLDMLLGCFMS